VQALLKENIICYRPIWDFTYDLENAPLEPIYLARSPVYNYAMRLFVEEYNSIYK